ncbi:hypothetical protein F511_01019 [Dorcoceras hygrometricum]|uniref:Uncharacterized protein n=1 Tax=Dorcoceras hygrometricum TaxID=472368 RepID=A0A2Z7AGI8_9LAMI|nr:hypothetical protein F511_01019 [Dorcoceras hygrometricum]
MPPRRSRLQETGETNRTENLSQGPENPNLTATQIAQLVVVTVEQILANRPDSNPPPDQQAEEIGRLQEEFAHLREERGTNPPSPNAREVPFSFEVLNVELPQHFKFPNVGVYDGMEDPEEHLSRFENAVLLHQYADPIKCRVFLTNLVQSTQRFLLSTGVSKASGTTTRHSSTSSPVARNNR